MKYLVKTTFIPAIPASTSLFGFKTHAKEAENERTVYRVLSETDTHLELEVPLFVCWGSTFRGWGRKRMITKKWVLGRKYEEMDSILAAKYDSIKKGDSVDVLFD